jgi:hypothetical protein
LWFPGLKIETWGTRIVIDDIASITLSGGRLMDDSLPNRDQDAVLTLYAHYFLAAELMRSNCLKLESKLKQRGRLSRKDTVEQGIYAGTWLGFLAVTCEGFKKLRFHLLLQENRPEEFRELIPKSDAIGKVIKQHADPLREFRNHIFHLRDDAGAIERFFAKGSVRLIWAKELHSAFGEFFSEYRVLCFVHYMTHDRTSESLGWLP